MCLQTLWKNPRIAKRPITVYKVLHNWGSIYQAGFRYEKNKLYKTTLKAQVDIYPECFDGDAVKWAREKGHKNLLSVSNGFHAMTTVQRAKGTGYNVYIAIIPKGAKYYKDGTDLIVSNKIKIKDELSNN